MQVVTVSLYDLQRMLDRTAERVIQAVEKNQNPSSGNVGKQKAETSKFSPVLKEGGKNAK